MNRHNNLKQQLQAGIKEKAQQLQYTAEQFAQLLRDRMGTVMRQTNCSMTTQCNDHDCVYLDNLGDLLMLQLVAQLAVHNTTL